MKYILEDGNTTTQYNCIEDLKEMIEERLVNRLEQETKLTENEFIMLQEYEDIEDELEICIHSETELSYNNWEILYSLLKTSGEKTETKQILTLLNMKVSKEYDLIIREVNERAINIAASDLTEAKEKVISMYDNQEIMLDEIEDLKPIEVIVA